MQPYRIEIKSFAQKAIKKLQKSYPNIKEDLKEPLSSLKYNPNKGRTIKGSPSPKMPLRKVPVRSTDLRKGKRQGYRIIYQVLIDSRTVRILFIILRKEGYPNQERILKALKELD